MIVTKVSMTGGAGREVVRIDVDSFRPVFLTIKEAAALHEQLGALLAERVEAYSKEKP